MLNYKSLTRDKIDKNTVMNMKTLHIRFKYMYSEITTLRLYGIYNQTKQVSSRAY